MYKASKVKLRQILERYEHFVYNHMVVYTQISR